MGVGGVTHHFRLEGRLDVPVLEAVPVDASEEVVLPDVPLPLRPAAQALGRVLGHQLGWPGSTGRVREMEGKFVKSRETGLSTKPYG